MIIGKWKQSLARLPTSGCCTVEKFGVIAFCLKIVRCLQRQSGRRRDDEIGRWRMGWTSLYALHTNSVWFLTGVKENSSRRSTTQRHQAIQLDANHCWQWGGLTPPTQGPGPGASQETAVDWNGNSGSNASEGGSVSLSLPVSLSVHPAALYYCHFLFALTHNHSWHIITFSMFSSKTHVQTPNL